MFRITTVDSAAVLTLRLEGRLAGPWVRVLEECWKSALAREDKPTVHVDLTGVTFVDATGESLLASLHRHGAELIAADYLTKALVTEITQETPTKNNRGA